MNNGSTLAIVLCVVWLSPGQAPLPASDMRSVTEIIEKDFGSVADIRTIGMTDEPFGRFDVVVVGSRPQNSGWQVEVFSVSNHKVTKTWNSRTAAKGTEFSVSGAKSVDINVTDYDYDVTLEACAPHLCYDGVSGFLIFSGKSGKTVKAKVVTQGLDQSFLQTPKYDVTFSPNIDSNSKMALEKLICNGRTLSNKSGLPFSCPNL